MENQTGKRSDPAALYRTGRIVQLTGLFDVALGIAFPFAGPALAPDANLQDYWWYGGAFFVVAGLGLAVYGHVLVRRSGESR